MVTYKDNESKLRETYYNSILYDKENSQAPLDSQNI